MKNFLIVVLIIAIIGGTGYGIYYQVDNHNKKNETSNEVEKNEEKQEVGEEIDINSDMVTNLMNKFSVLNNPFSSDTYLGYLYSQDKIMSENFDDVAKVLVAGNQLLSKETDKSYLDNTTGLIKVYTKDQIKLEMQKIFGQNVTYKDVSGPANACENKVVYDENKGTYSYYSEGCGGIGIPFIKTKIERATKYSDRLEIIEKSAYIDYVEVPNNSDDLHLVQSIHKNKQDTSSLGTLEVDSNQDVFTLYGNQLNSYKYTFIYDNGNYYFNSIELVK